MRSLINAILITIFLLSFVIACSKTNDTNSVPVDCSGSPKSFATDVAPLIQTYCATNSGCHANGSHDGILTTYQDVYDKRNTIYAEVHSGRMPKNTSLPSAARNAILCWIDNGALNN